MIFDTHCHYNLEPLFTDWQNHWREAQLHGVHQSMVVGTNEETSQRGVEIAQQAPNLFASIGIHPHVQTDLVISKHQENESFEQIKKQFDTQLEKDHEFLLTLAKKNKVVAIGETGLDFFHSKASPFFEEISTLQQAGFEMQIFLALHLQLPLIIHVRDTDDSAYWQILSSLRQKKIDIPFILHCVSGPLEYIKEAVQMGAYLSFAGNVTYPSSQMIREIALIVPPEKILIETDAPYLPPQKYRGKTCFPSMISDTLSFLQHEFHVEEEQLVDNAHRVFSIKE